MSAVGPINLVGFFLSWPRVRHPTELLFQMEGGVEVGVSAGEELRIPIEVGVSAGEVPGDLVEVAWVEVPLQLHPEQKYSGW